MSKPATAPPAKATMSRELLTQTAKDQLSPVFRLKVQSLNVCVVGSTTTNTVVLKRQALPSPAQQPATAAAAAAAASAAAATY